MKHTVLLLGSLSFLLLSACMPTPIPTPVAMIATAMTSSTGMPTSTLAPTHTPKATSTSTRNPTVIFTATSRPSETFTPSLTATKTKTPSPISTRTATATRTRIPTRTPLPSFEWSTGFDTLDGLDNYQLGIHGQYKVVADPTNSGHGNVLKGDAAPDLAYYDLQYYDGVGTTVVRSYPAYYFPAKPGPHKVGVDVYLENDFEPKVGSLFPNGPNLSLLSDFFDTEGFGKKWQVGPTANLWNLGNERYAIRLGGNLQGEQTINAPRVLFKPNRWYRVDIEVTHERKALLYQDGHLVAWAMLADDIGVATSGGHAGLYGLGAKGQQHPPYTSGTLYNDNWSIIVWSQ